MRRKNAAGGLAKSRPWGPSGTKAKTKGGISENIRRESASGKPRDQAIAIAMRKAGKTKKRR